MSLISNISARTLLWFSCGVMLGIVANRIGSDVFNVPYATALMDQHSRLLSCELAADQQWRFQPNGEIPPKLSTCIQYFEDEYFYAHPGVNPISMIRALRQNAAAGRVVSGGSTITMQVARMSMKNTDRTVVSKLTELLYALCIESAHTKSEILQLWADNAPFGGNIVGFQAASYAYFARPPKELSWSEAALLAVLPNQPSMMYPGRNQAPLQAKRNTLLRKLYAQGEIDSVTMELSLLEPLPNGARDFPQLVPHLLVRCKQDGLGGQTVTTTIDAGLQGHVQKTVDNYTEYLQRSGIHNAAVLITHVPTGEVHAYVGNSRNENTHNVSVDMIGAPRSTGSILKPLLHAARLDYDMLPFQLLPDYPMSFSGFRPRNYTRTWKGAAPADEALAQSLNVPAIHSLSEYGVSKFLNQMQRVGFKTMQSSAQHYGLSLIVGGAEATAWDLAGVYSAISNSVQRFNKDGEVSPVAFSMGYLSESTSRQEFTPIASPGASYATLQAMTKVERPSLSGNWQAFTAPRNVAWKTGTSYGLRDAWSVAITPEYTVVVWVGNAAGEGRAGLTGYGVAAPLLFSVLNALPPTSWFNVPAGNMQQVRTCAESGLIASPTCNNIREVYSSVHARNTAVCTYCTVQLLDTTRSYRVTSEDSEFVAAVADTAFVLPAKIEWFYRQHNPGYRGFHPLRASRSQAESTMQFVYPEEGDIIHLPVEFDNERQPAVAKVIGLGKSSTVFWHLNDQCIGVTNGRHEQPILASPGSYTLSAITSRGDRRSVHIEIRH